MCFRLPERWHDVCLAKLSGLLVEIAIFLSLFCTGVLTLKRGIFCAYEKLAVTQGGEK